jgi:hypothetical protein
METKYFVAEAFRYAESKKWEYKISGVYDTLEDAKQEYHSRGGAIIKDTNDHAMVIIYDSYGNKIMSDYVNTYVAPEPEPEAE